MKGTIGKKVGMIAILNAMIGAARGGEKPDVQEAQRLQHQKNTLLVNGFSGPEPRKVPNQRQRRKLLRQVPQLRNRK